MNRDPSTVAVAMSGGLDSSVAAASLSAAGWTVFGLHFVLPAPAAVREQRIQAVSRVARRLGIPLEVIDLRTLFDREVIEPFVDGYVKGLTPNPCVVCNEKVKFQTLLDYAETHGLRCLATGHYARIGQNGVSSPELRRGRAGRKEQSYFLHRLHRAQLERAVFPLGDVTKGEVRRRARLWGLPTQGVSESQEVCFIADNDYRRFVAERSGGAPGERGNIVDERGAVLGTHGGTYRYTIGQRHGLGLSSPRAYYVKAICVEKGEVMVGRREDLYARAVQAGDVNWTVTPPREGERFTAEAQVRYRHRAAPGSLRVMGQGRITFSFEEPQWAVTPGQALVCYDGDRVLGGGWIERRPAGPGSGVPRQSLRGGP